MSKPNPIPTVGKVVNGQNTSSYQKKHTVKAKIY